MSAKRRIEPYHVAAAVLALLAVLSVGKTLFSGLEIDEQYALSISWRLVKGDALFYTMWEPHQLSALPESQTSGFAASRICRNWASGTVTWVSNLPEISSPGLSTA